MILPFCECKTDFHKRNCVPSAECVLKCRETHPSSEQLFITSVFALCPGTVQKGQESSPGGAAGGIAGICVLQETSGAAVRGDEGEY